MNKAKGEDGDALRDVTLRPATARLDFDSRPSARPPTISLLLEDSDAVRTTSHTSIDFGTESGQTDTEFAHEWRNVIRPCK